MPKYRMVRWLCSKNDTFEFPTPWYDSPDEAHGDTCGLGTDYNGRIKQSGASLEIMEDDGTVSLAVFSNKINAYVPAIRTGYGAELVARDPANREE